MSSLNSAPDRPGFDEMLSEAFRVGLDLPAETDLSTLAFERHRHWDSLGHMSLIATLERTFGVSLGEQDVLEIDSYASAAAVLRSKDRAAP
jgi:acyl carrier protein